MSDIDYARMDVERRRHHARFVARVKREGLVCQDCGGMGGCVEPIDRWLGGPWAPCGWCEGTGRVTRWLRGRWLRCRRQEVTP